MIQIIHKIVALFRIIIAFFHNVNHTFTASLSRLRVFYQIMIVITVMVFFLALEGFMNLRTVDSMQRLSKSIYTNSVQGYVAVSVANIYIVNLEKSYLSALLQNAPVPFTYQEGLNFLYPIHTIDESVYEGINQSYENINKIMQEPMSMENFDKMRVQTTYILGSIQQLRNQVNIQGVQSMTTGNSEIITNRRNTFIILLVSLIISVFLGWLITTSLSRSLNSIATAASSLATGDLSLKIQAEGCREVVEAIKGLNNATLGLQKLVEGINEQSQALSDSSKILMTASEESGRATVEVATAMEDLSKSITQQTSEISLITRIITDVNGMVQKVSLDLEEIAGASTKVSESAYRGQNLNNEIVEEINALFLSTQEIASAVNELSRNSGRIGNIISLIEDLAEQINLLALNAAIEAARAGEYGRGFSVVANQTGKLADQSKQAAQMITELLNENGSQVQQVVTIINKELTRVENGKLITKQAAVTFEDIFAKLREILARIDTTAVLAKEMAGKNGDVNESVLTISAVSEETMASTEEISATATEQSVASVEVSRMAVDLGTIAERLQQSVAVFTIDKAENNQAENEELVG